MMEATLLRRRLRNVSLNPAPGSGLTPVFQCYVAPKNGMPMQVHRRELANTIRLQPNIFRQNDSMMKCKG